ncbi:MAG: NnrS family protein [Rhodospirillales bacterium]|nr:NnrS family protein [Rhodospirillales bacterium]
MASQILLNINEPGSDYKGPLLLTSGHRPFFLFAALYAVMGMFLWVLALHGYVPMDSAWHGHEMVFGFATAAITGFLLAASPKWTNTTPIHGKPLALLIALWLLGRVAMWFEDFAFLDLLYLPVFGFMIMRVIMSVQNKRNYQVFALTYGLALMNVLYHFDDQSLALRAGIYLVIAVLVLIGGRVIPAFTQNALRMQTGQPYNCETPAILDKLAVPMVVLVAATELMFPDTHAPGGIAVLTGILLFVRMLKWQTLKTFGIPLVWILHIAYLWIPVGFVLKGLGDFGLMDPSSALHALTSGAVGVMILAVGSRAALGHSGRPLVATKSTIVAYILVIAAALVRVFLPIELSTMIAGGLWTLGWGVFAVAYWPVLVHPRIDGMPG